GNAGHEISLLMPLCRPSRAGGTLFRSTLFVIALAFSHFYYKYDEVNSAYLWMKSLWILCTPFT
ncbi:hypothetical protein, partial [Escherichia sp. MOD1-EC5457]|uniref:hypothetical protein n=1 Tax=Escherichia sp. MOD1-EC5457 TaxID=2093874 RepID=UPI001A7E10B4